MIKKLIRKMLTAAGGLLQLTPEELKYLEWSKMTPLLKREYRTNRAKSHLLSGPNITNFWEAFQTYIGNRDPKNPHLNIGIVNVPGRATPQLVLLSAKLMETINSYWKNLGKLKIRLGGNGKYASGILTKPGTAPTTFNGQNINYITSPKGGNVTHKFYTDQGSEYILTKDGFARRVKSSHANTGGADAGLHEWNKGATRFLDSDELGWSYHAWTDRTKPLGFSEKDGIISLVTKDNGKWRYVMRSELRPNAIKNGTIKDGIILSAYTTEPKIGKWMLEYGTNPTGEINWFHPGSQVAFIEGLKQGGKMNTLLFLKNGSGIHIKKKNRGKFTDYCGGKVTSECIARGKRSSNPAVRKRATFADNVRHFKHKEGGKAFVEGVNVLDSNPKAYKYVKKKYQMALEGTKLNFWLKTGNFLNGGLGQTLMNGIAGVIKTTAENKNVDAQVKAAQALNEADWALMMNLIVRQNLEENNRNYMQWVSAYLNGLIQDLPSLIVAAHMGLEKLNQDLATGKQNLKNKNSQISSAAQAAKSKNWTNTFGNIVQQGMGTIGQLIGNNTNSGTNKTNFGTSDYKLQLPEIWTNPTLFDKK